MELHPDVVWFIKHRCNRDEVDAFYRQLEALRREPIRNSEAIAEPRLSRYMLRFFRFTTSLAVFHYDAAKDRIRVLECRRVKPSRGAGGAGEPR